MYSLFISRFRHQYVTVFCRSAGVCNRLYSCSGHFRIRSRLGWISAEIGQACISYAKPHFYTGQRKINRSPSPTPSDTPPPPFWTSAKVLNPIKNTGLEKKTLKYIVYQKCVSLRWSAHYTFNHLVVYQSSVV